MRFVTIVAALLCSGCTCIVNRHTTVNVRADDHFDIRPVVRDVSIQMEDGHVVPD